MAFELIGSTEHANIELCDEAALCEPSLPWVPDGALAPAPAEHVILG